MLEQAQDLQDGDAARTRRTHAADSHPGAIGSANRIAQLDLVGGQVLAGQQTGVAGCLADRLDHGSPDVATIERRAALGRDPAQGVGEGRIA
jgi:hypothetical protein